MVFLNYRCNVVRTLVLFHDRRLLRYHSSLSILYRAIPCYIRNPVQFRLATTNKIQQRYDIWSGVITIVILPENTKEEKRIQEQIQP